MLALSVIFPLYKNLMTHTFRVCAPHTPVSFIMHLLANFKKNPSKFYPLNLNFDGSKAKQLTI